MIQAILDENGLLNKEQISYIINNTDLDKFSENDNYFTGNNPTIYNKDDPTDTHFPNNKIPIPYGRKLSLTTKNYMFNKPVMYLSEDETYLTNVQRVFDNNMNQEKIDKLGLDLIVQGVAYKLFWYDDQANIRYTIIDGEEIIPVYNYDIEPKLVCAVRFYVLSDFLDSANDKTIIECYYQTQFIKYEITGTTIDSGSMNEIESTPHGFDIVPLVVYGDNWQLGVFDAVKKLIDGVDTITSTNLDEIEKFALAYLVLSGQRINADDVEKIVEKRFFELEPDAVLKYLTKELNYEFHGNVLEFLVSEIHKQSGVPDFASKDFAAESGIALRYKLMGFENLASSIEYIFKQGEQDSIDIINSALYNVSDYDRFQFYDANPNKVVTIEMSRNIPENDSDAVAIATQLKLLGVSMETIIDSLPMVENTEDELGRIDEEKQKNIEMFGQNMIEDTQDNEDNDQNNNNNDQNVDE